MNREQVISILRGDAQRGLISKSIVSLLIDHYDSINERRDQESKAAGKTYQETLSSVGE